MEEIELLMAKLDIKILEYEISCLRKENMDLKQFIASNVATLKTFKKVNHTTKEKWDYYHEHKNELLQSLGTEVANWREIKRTSDALYNANTSRNHRQLPEDDG